MLDAPPEVRPPRPLVPSLFIEDDTPEPPPSATMRAAAERGRLLHQLFERLPALDPGERPAAADRWLERAAGVVDVELRRELVEAACTLVSDPDFAEIFGAEALAEAPIAAVTPDGSVVTGTVDRLLVTADRICVVDFKTGRRVPETPAAVPVPHLRQMAAYVAALEVIFPGRRVEAALLYTSGPRLHALAPNDLQPYLPGHCG
jgi:ATP-dependent helicase/nuclease subunit A